ncbi:MAG: CoA transferase [Bacteriovoracaceae bacterium]|jgi:crotonobetainyl-CoA:carnitine CoA-transferase CaiB-like acyl-CoA transferase|nr:CoA transferase [Bacteriovoracaceae bacterium]
MNKILEGIKVLDLTRLLPGPYATTILSDLGAEIIKIEDRESGDYIRHIPPIKNKNSYSFLTLNRNKNYRALNLKDRGDLEVFYDLVKSSDVVIEGFRPGVVKSLGIDFETLKELNPQLVYCSISGYGQTGPLSKKAGHDINYLALSGLLGQILDEDNRPTVPKSQLADIAGGSLWAVIAVLTGLFSSKVKKQSCYFDVSMLEGMLFLSPLALADLQAPKSGLYDILGGKNPNYCVYKTKDQLYMALGAVEQKFWDRFCMGIDLPELTEHHLCVDEKQHQQIKSKIAQKTQSEWEQIFCDIDACFTPVLSLEDAINHPHMKDRNVILEIQHPDDGNIQQFALPIR